MRNAILVLIPISILMVLAACGGDDDRPEVDLETYPYAVEQPEEITDRSHFDIGVTYDDYTSNPPTSGPHANRWAESGIHDTAVPKEQLVHNMEHAHVIVWYNCNADPALNTDECTDLRNSLSQVVQEQLGEGREVVMTPYPSMDSRIALTSWGFLDIFEEFDEERVRTFIQTFECYYDPEGFC